MEHGWMGFSVGWAERKGAGAYQSTLSVPLHPIGPTQKNRSMEALATNPKSRKSMDVVVGDGVCHLGGAGRR
jgi:hypothetical protein